MNDFEELLYNGKSTKSEIKKMNRRYFIMIIVISLGIYIANQIWHFQDDLAWYGCILEGFLITTGLWGLYVYVYKALLRSRHKILYLIFIIAFILFKLLPYILGWKKF